MNKQIIAIPFSVVVIITVIFLNLVPYLVKPLVTGDFVVLAGSFSLICLAVFLFARWFYSN